MSQEDIYIANSHVVKNNKHVEGEYVFEGEEMLYKISNYEEMRVFFMTIVSPSDHWLFISSNGALSAGRKNTNSSLFPYYTHDKIADSSEITGSKSIFRIQKEGRKLLWEPFSDRYLGIYNIERNIYKIRKGNKIIFEEINKDLAVTFRYSWTFSNKYGFVKKSCLSNNSNDVLQVEVLDGIQNILPFGVNDELQSTKSNLVDAYKKSELDSASGIGIYSLSAMIVDKAEASETLAATSVWAAGIQANNHLLSSLQLNAFRKGFSINNEIDKRAERGAYFVHSELSLEVNSTKNWYIVSEVNQSLSSIVKLKNELGSEDNIIRSLEIDIEKGNDELMQLVSMADGIQLSEDKLINGRHFSNVLFNCMRGGLFSNQYKIDLKDLTDYIETINRPVYKKNEDFLRSLADDQSYQSLLSEIEKMNDMDLERICIEYLPLSFSRRHGDPSRPWNEFSIEINDKKGKKIKNYEGNWRDIFQNWEALAISFPNFIEGMITKFLNATTIDGYNPYRITRDGIDWETVDENDPWSFIGYWGDHQIIYLLKLLELSEAYHPSKLKQNLSKNICVYANVPYRIKKYNDILKNASDTIDFDHDLATTIESRVEEVGADGKIIWDNNEQIARANFAEKIVLTALTKLYNFIPEAGIWLNTQRPEWNDANNALVGDGVSMVTLYYLNRYLNFCIDLFGDLEESEIEFNSTLATLYEEMEIIFRSNIGLLENSISDKDRKKIMDALGKAGEDYRMTAYSGSAGNYKKLKVSAIIEFFKVCNAYLEHSIKANKRNDHLYHAYNLIDTNKGTIDPLYEMLEGQVGVLSAKYLPADEVLNVLDALKSSRMFRSDQYSYMLYPDRELPTFLEKNIIPKDFSNNSQLIEKLLQDDDSTLVEKDVNGDVHFNSHFHNANDLKNSLDKLGRGAYSQLVANEHTSFLAVFEKMFDHKSFTGRSGTFYAFEGLGSIYWHMVSKLLLAVQENIMLAKKEGADPVVIGKLIDHYYEIRAGIGINKSPDLYGAFPTDAYSHTPGNAGAQQPGMTGQVKEDIINRWAELGLIVQNGEIHFEPSILKKEEFLKNEEVYHFTSINNTKESITLPKNSLAFTYCQVPIIYLISDEAKIEVNFDNRTSLNIEGSALPADLSLSIFCRNEKVKLLKVYLKSEA